MTVPVPAAATWFAGRMVDAGVIDGNVVNPINVLPRGRLGSISSNTAVTLATLGQQYASSVSVTFSIGASETRRIEIWVQARYSLGTTTNGLMLVQAAYSVGGVADPTSMTLLMRASGVPNYTGQTSATFAPSGSAAGDVSLSTGTYTAFAAVQRGLLGAASDTAVGFTVIVKDVGAG